MDFPVAPLDRAARLWVGGHVLAIAGFIALLFVVSPDGSAVAWWLVLLPAAWLVWLGWRYLGAPVAYRVTGPTLEVLRRARPTRRFALTGDGRGLGDPSRLRAESVRFGNYYGCRWATDTRRDPRHATIPEHQRVYVAATDLDRALLLEVREGGGVLITPQDPDGLMMVVRAAVP